MKWWLPLRHQIAALAYGDVTRTNLGTKGKFTPIGSSHFMVAGELGARGGNRIRTRFRETDFKFEFCANRDNFRQIVAS